MNAPLPIPPKLEEIKIKEPDLEESEILLRIISENMEHARHLESQRSSMANFLITISTAIIAFIIEKNIGQRTLSLSICLVLIGAYGLIISLKFSQRFHLHYMRAKYFRLRLYENYKKIEFEKIESVAEEKNREKFPWVTGAREKFELFYLWVYLYIGIILMGLFFFFSAIF